MVKEVLKVVRTKKIKIVVNGGSKLARKKEINSLKSFYLRMDGVSQKIKDGGEKISSLLLVVSVLLMIS